MSFRMVAVILLVIMCIAIFGAISILYNSHSNRDNIVVSQGSEEEMSGTLVYSGNDGQCIRMWEIPHRMEWWLMQQNDIQIERMYCFQYGYRYRIYLQYNKTNEEE